MSVISINLKPDERILRQFGYFALVGFGLIGCAAWQQFGWVGRALAGGGWAVVAVLWGLGTLSAVFSLVYPRANRPLFVTLVVATAPIGLVVSYVLMAALFYLVVMPTGLAMRALASDPLQRRWHNGKTYWTKARPQRSKDRYFRQY